MTGDGLSRRMLILAAVSSVLAPTAWAADDPSVVAVAGKPNLPLGSFDVGPLGHQVDEFLVSGTAISYKLAGKGAEDGKWDTEPADPDARDLTLVIAPRVSRPALSRGAHCADRNLA